MTHEKVLTPHEKSISEARINYNSYEVSKTFILHLMLDGGVFEVKSEKKKLRKLNCFLFF